MVRSTARYPRTERACAAIHNSWYPRQTGDPPGSSCLAGSYDVLVGARTLDNEGTAMVPSIDRIIGQVPGFVKAHRSTLCRPVVTGGHQEPVHDTDLWVRRDIYKEVLPVSSPFSSGDAGGQVRPLLRGRLPAGRLAVTTVGLSPPSRRQLVRLCGNACESNLPGHPAHSFHMLDSSEHCHYLSGCFRISYTCGPDVSCFPIAVPRGALRE